MVCLGVYLIVVFAGLLWLTGSGGIVPFDCCLIELFVCGYFSYGIWICLLLWLRLPVL